MKKVVKKEARAKRINSKEFFGKKNIFMTHGQNALWSKEADLDQLNTHGS